MPADQCRLLSLTPCVRCSASTIARPSLLPPMEGARPPPVFGGLAQFAPSRGGSRSMRGASRSQRDTARPRLDRTEPQANFKGFATGLQSELGSYRPPASAAESSGGRARSPYKRRGRLSPGRAQSVSLGPAVEGADRVSPERSPAGAGRASPSKGLATHTSIEQLVTAWDAIEYLTRVNPDSQPAGGRAPEADTAARFVHLNLADNKEFRPYDLVVTDELHRNPEHFTMSSAGMFHTVPGEESEFFSLEEWSQNAVAFSQCCRITFFKSYTVTKGFYFWRKCVNQQRFRRKRDTVGRQLFGHRKSFRSTYKVLVDAYHEARCVELCDIEMRRKYTLVEFRDRQIAARKTGQQELSSAVEKMEAELVWLCDQLKQRKRESEMKEENDDKELARAIETHMSMSEVRTQQQKRARLLNEAISEAEEVGTFVRLADMTAVETAVLLATESVVGIQAHLQRHLKEVSHGMFVVVVDMDAEQVEYSPTMAEFLDVMREAVDDIVRIVVKAPRLAFVRQLASYLETDASQFSSVADLLQTNLEFAQAQEEVMQTIKENFERVLAAGAELEQFREMYNFGTVWHQAKDEYTFKKHDVLSARGLQGDLQKALEWKELLGKQMRISREIGIFHMDTRALRDRLKPLVDSVVEDMKQHLVDVAGKFTTDALVEAQRTVKALKDKPRTVTDFAELMAVVKQDRSDLLIKVDCCDQLYGTLQETGVKMSTDDSLKHDELHDSMQQMQDAAAMALREVDSLHDQMCSELDKNIAFHTEELGDILKELGSSAFTDTSLPPTDVLARLERISVQLRIAEKNLEQCMAYEEQFKNVALSDRTSLDEALQVFAYREELWTRVQKWQDAEHGWLTASFSDLDVQSIGETVTTYLKVAHKLYKQYKEPLVLETLQESADRYHQWMPPLLDLGNPAMQRRHWKVIFEHLGVPAPTEFSLQDLIDWKVFENRTVITETSAIASGEWSLAQSLRKVEKSMAAASFTLAEYCGVPILTGVDDLYEALEENKMTLQIMRSSRFIDGVKQDVETWERKLHLIDQVLDEWLYCQRNWRYLQNIFTVPDIQKQLPSEAADFRHVDTKWKDIMAKTANNPNVVECTTAPGVLEMFLDNRTLLQTVQRSLDDYLETKRMAFARFYFLSDDELLQILSQTKEPKAVQPHLNKLFVGIRRLQFGSAGGSVLAQIDAMISAEGETVNFDQEVVISKTTNVEDWLNTVQSRMVQTLRNRTRVAYYSLTGLNGVAMRTTQPDDEWSEDRKEWLFSCPAMCVIAVEQIVWKDEMEKCLEAINPEEALEGVCQQESRKLVELTDLVTRDLPPQDLSTIEALLVISIHEREMTEDLRAKRVSSTADFNWLRQLKYCWDVESEKLSLLQARAQFAYLYEYLGNSSRLVITPLTDRCYLTMTNALMMKLGGCPYGKAGTGKTETVKDLAKALARQCIVFNCSDGLDHKIMGKFFSGLAQSGAWACFDEFNRIEVDVLSVISTQCLTIQQALMGDLEKFAFDGRMITLDRNYGCFVTMNPSAGGSYGGRAELPDNLKSQFRPVAMMVPDTVLIARSMLFAQGFITSMRLARKVTQLYKMAAEQLSFQKHYDWELRAMKPVLSMAGSLKRSDRGTDEDLLLIRALRQSSIPKLVGKDIALFNALIEDLFPNVAVPDSNFGALQEAVEAHLEKLNYTVVPTLVEKIIQLLETLKVRHGVGLVGAPGTGKSVAQEILSAALADLSEREPQYRRVVRKVLNPKAISIGRLYGEYNEVSAEWTDGLVPAIVREMITDTRLGATKWITFDGPVDPFWIENMNTVLDDNKLLCLLNGERIKLPNNINMLFEVEDLKHASPATVSRCGMVYFDKQVLGWRPVVAQWLKKNAKLKKLFPAGFADLLDSTLDATLTFLNSAAGEPDTPDIHCVQRFFDFLGAILTAEFVDHLIPPAPAGQGSREQEVAAEQAIVAHPDFFSMSMAFAFIWSFGAKRPRAPQFASMFNMFATDLIPKFCPSFPDLGSSSVYDYCIDYRVMQWQLWSATLPQFHYDPAALEQMVPTVDGICATYLMRVLVMFGDINVLLTGQSGTAKTSIMREFRRSDDTEALSFAYVPFSARSTSEDFQPVVEGQLDERSKDLLGPPSDTKMIILVDDLSLPQPDAFATQQTTECVRQLIDSRGFYDAKGLFWKQVVDTQIVAARTPHGGGHSQICGRLLRHFHMIGLMEPDDADLLTIFGSLLSGWVENGADVTASSVLRWLPAYIEKAAAGSIALFSAVRDKLLPTPAKCHYVFNLRDILRVFEGLRCYQMKHLQTQNEFIRLWAHESCRVFVDGLSEQEEISWFHDIVANTIESRFEVKWGLHHFVPSHFGAFNISSSDRDYRERVVAVDLAAGDTISTLSQEQMVADLKDALFQYQLSAPMELVLFDDVLRHLSATCRVFRQGRGNMLLLGQSGCGRRSVVKLAAHIMEAEFFEIRLARGYGLSEFREDLRPLLQSAGVAQRPVVFFLADGQIVEESFLRDVSSILETGRVPGLFSDEEMNLLHEELKQSRPRGASDTRPLEQVLVDNVLKNLHFAISLVPVGERYQQWMRMYPALTSWSSVDWYHSWPDSALVAVAQSHLGRDEVLHKAEAKVDANEDADTRKEPDVAEKRALLTDVNQVCQACVGITDAVNIQLEKLPGTALVITPKFFVELLKVFKSMLVEKETRLNNGLQRLRGGLDKLFMCNDTVEQMQADLTNLQPQLAQMAEETINLMGALAHDKEEADRVSALVRRDQNKVEDMTRNCEDIARAAQKDLADAMPAFHAAVEALNTLKREHITELKTFKDPPPLVKTTMEAICVMKFVEPSWKSAQKILQEFNFLDSLKKYPKDDVTDETRIKLSKYINDPSFNADAVGKVSVACKSLCMWVLAIDQYAEVNEQVRPKKARLKQAQDKAAEMQAQLQEKQNELAEVTARLRKLEQDYQDSLAKRDELNNRMDDAKIRIARAETLTTQLADEQTRWSAMSKKLESDRGQLVGDTLLAAAFIGYAGPFDVTNRTELVKQWVAIATSLKLPVASNFTLEYTLGDPVELREWKLQGLPQDMFSIENSLVVANTRRWPLVTDPQDQAGTWIKNMEKGNGIQVIKANDPNLLRIVENSIQMGIPVLIENVGESIDPNMRPIYQKKLSLVAGRKVIRLGDVDVDYNPLFKLYMTCNLPNPSYTADVYTTLTVINFAVSKVDLSDQLLTMVVAHEKPELEDQKDTLILEINKGEKMLNQVEEEILDMLKSASSNILADDDLIQQLDMAKTTSNRVKSQIEEAERTSAAIDKSRNAYETIATRGAVLYFAMAKLSSLSPMYHYSLGFFRDLFTRVMKNTKKTNDLDARLELLTDALMQTVFDKVCRGLFEKDKLLFSFMIAANISQEAGAVTPQEWEFLVRGMAVQVDGDTQTESPPKLNPCSSWLNDTTWGGLVSLATLPRLESVTSCIGGSQQEAWRRFRSDPEMHKLPLPNRDLQSSLSLFQRLLLIKTLREDALELAVIHFVEKSLGRSFVEPTNASLQGCFEDSTAHVPTVFILSPGADPTQMHLSFARTKDMEDRLDFVSLGRGQGPTAEKLIRKGCDGGRWVCLQNCHLFLQWMPRLESLVEELPQLVDDASAFRLWLTSYPAEGFPVPVIQCSVKMANEMPHGLRANLLRTYRDFSSSKFDAVVPVKRKLLFSLAFLHAALLDRCTFGSIGFNNPYEWTAADLDISLSVLNQELNESTVEETLTYMIGQVYYGGRVTDPWDQRCVQSLLAKYLKSGRSQHDIPFDEDGKYGCPQQCESQPDCIKYIMSLPINTDPSVFGLHESADVAFRTNSSEALLEKIVTTGQTQTAAKVDTLNADNALVLELTEQLLAKLGEPLAVTLQGDGVDPIGVVLEQEVVQYNRLHSNMRQSLEQLKEAIDGHGVMTKSLDAVFHAMLVLRVPQEWKDTIGDVSHKALASWAAELGNRLELLRDWCAYGPPISFYLPGLAFPQGLLAGIRQQYGRKNNIAIDTLQLHTQPTKLSEPDGLRWIPDLASYGGVYIHGLVLEGARWDADGGLLKDPVPNGTGVAGARFCDMPVMWCQPVILRDVSSPIPQSDTPRISTPGPSEADTHGDRESDVSLGSGPTPLAFTNAVLNRAPPSVAGDLDSEIAALTSTSTSRGKREKDRENSTSRSRQSVTPKNFTPYARSPTPQPDNKVIYPEPKRSFTCPVYKTAHRGADPAGYVMSCELASAGKPDNWVLRGTALMCEGDVR